MESVKKEEKKRLKKRGENREGKKERGKKRGENREGKKERGKREGENWGTWSGNTPSQLLLQLLLFFS